MTLPLQGKRILVTRPAAQADALAQLIVGQGGKALVFPLLDIAPADEAAPLEATAARLADYHMVVFISPNALAYAWPVIQAKGGWPEPLMGVAVGQSTAVQLRAAGIARVVVPTERFDSEALLELPEMAGKQVAGKRILILRGNGGRELLADTLRTRGAVVDCVSCYQRQAPGDAGPLLSWLRNRQLDAVTVSSSESLRNLFALLDTEACERLRELPVFVPHQRIAEMAGGLGLPRVVLTGPADAGIVAGLCEHVWSENE